MANGVVRVRARNPIVGDGRDPRVFVTPETEGVLLDYFDHGELITVKAKWDAAYPLSSDECGERKSFDHIELSTTGTIGDIVSGIEIDWGSADDPDDDQDLDPIGTEHSEVVRQAIYAEPSLFGGDDQRPPDVRILKIPAVGQRVREDNQYGVVVRIIVEDPRPIVVFRDDYGKDHYTDPLFVDTVGAYPRTITIAIPEGGPK